ncbi:MAG: rhodanese-like domain-containing protein [Desulfovibrionaceae bacterium]
MVRHLVSEAELEELQPWVRAKIERNAARGGYTLIGTPELVSLLQRYPDCLLVDARDPEAYEDDHIQGARNFMMGDSWWTRLCRRAAFRRLLGPDPLRPLVFYCTRPTCTYSDAAPSCAVRLGYRKVFRYFPGIVAWMRHRLPLEGLQQRCLLTEHPAAAQPGKGDTPS